MSGDLALDSIVEITPEAFGVRTGRVVGFGDRGRVLLFNDTSTAPGGYFDVDRADITRTIGRVLRACGGVE